jgi:hypothetical protein
MAKTAESTQPLESRHRQRFRSDVADQIQTRSNHPSADLDIGCCLRKLRTGRGLFIRFLAERNIFQVAG